MVNVTTWVARGIDGAAIVARGQVTYANTEANRHLVEGAIQVLPEYRRQGLARQLLARFAAKMRDEKRRLMITDSSGRVPAGAAFMERLGAERGLETHIHQLRIDELDRSVIQKWQDRAAERDA